MDGKEQQQQQKDYYFIQFISCQLSKTGRD